MSELSGKTHGGHRWGIRRDPEGMQRARYLMAQVAGRLAALLATRHKSFIWARLGQFFDRADLVKENSGLSLNFAGAKP